MRRYQLLALVTGVLAALSNAGCVRKAPLPPDAALLPSRPPDATPTNERPESPVLFADATQKAGLDHRWTIPGPRPLDILQSIGNGCAFLDYNADGNLDILLVGRPPALYRGDGRGRFVNTTREAGMESLQGHFLGCATGDFDNDGDTDLYLSAYRGGALLRNEGRRRFVDVTRAAGVKPQPWGTSCAFADIDRDGRLDLYVANYVVFPREGPRLCDFHGILSGCGPHDYRPEFGALYRNEGGGRFRDATRAWGAARVSGYALGVGFADYDGSGRQSLALANDQAPGDLLRNTGRTFDNVGVASGTAFGADGKVHAGMGIDWGDFDNNQRPDLVVTTYRNQAKSIYQNEAGGFTDRGTQLGIEATIPYLAFGVKWLDYDNDGWLDLLIANGHVQDNIGDVEGIYAYTPPATYREPTQLFRNRQEHGFRDESAGLAEAARRPIVGRGLAVGDYDNDGRIDALVVDGEGSPLLLHNATPHAGRWLSIRLIGSRSNRDSLGARVTVTTDSHRLLRLCSTGGSYLSASDPRVHFGLGSARTVDVRVDWPSGRVTSQRRIPTNQKILLREP